MTLLIGGIPAAIYERIRGSQESTPVSLGIWLVVLALGIAGSATLLGPALPGTATMGVDLLKSTSLLVTIAAGELMSQAQLIASETFRAMEVYLVIAAIYFAVCYPLSQLLLLLERKVRAGTPLTLARRRRVRKTRALLAAGAVA